MTLLSLAHDFCDGVPNGGSGFLDLLFGKTNRNTNLERRRHDLLGLEIVVKNLETSNHDTVGKTLDQGKGSAIAGWLRGWEKELSSTNLVDNILKNILLIVERQSL